MRASAAQAVAQAAQGFRRNPVGRTRDPAWPALLAQLGTRVNVERDSRVRGMLALSLGRLPYATPQEMLQAQEWLIALAGDLRGDASTDVARGIETFARLTRERVPLAEPLLAPVRGLARDERADPPARRSALGALLAAKAADSATLNSALRSADPLLRRLAFAGVAGGSDPEARAALLLVGVTDASALVRAEALRHWARVTGETACVRLLEATRDTVPMVGLLALDLTGSSCAGNPQASRILLAVAWDSTARWQRQAHALVSLARVAPAGTREALGAARSAPVWQLRMYAARAALLLRDTTTLRRLATDPTANVREAVLGALRELSGHSEDSLYRAALRVSDYQLVLTAANALAGSPEPRKAAAALLAALERISRERSETSRDPRLAILARLAELGGPDLAPRLRRYLEDFDPVVADSAAALLASWTGRAARARPRPLVPVPLSLGELARLRGKRLRFSMASGASFDVALLVDAAPLTVLRVVGLAARGYYDGLTFHRVVPNFVIQGGSPGANEYAGQPRFMRDELGPLSHQRGTLGISTRGRDTGDAQLFVNLVDNPRLDYDYTVWGRVISGMEAVDGILEGEVIRRVTLVAPSP
ncbi:MAG TPA: peptidylprolyl isomerase [Gemmatimonadales bacterium]|nr:peptidylprolyl isomerase [Gemmatimonadales bacterium]